MQRTTKKDKLRYVAKCKIDSLDFSKFNKETKTIECLGYRDNDNQEQTLMATVEVKNPTNEMITGLLPPFVDKGDYSLPFYRDLAKQGKHPNYNNGLVSPNSIHKLIGTVKKFKLLEKNALEDTIELKNFFRLPENKPHPAGKGLPAEILIKLIDVYKKTTNKKNMILFALAMNGIKRDFNLSNGLIKYYQRLGFQVMFIPALYKHSSKKETLDNAMNDTVPIMIASFEDILNSDVAKSLSKDLEMNFILKK